MRNPLLDSMEASFATREGHIPFWSFSENGQVLLGHTGDVKYLIETANKYLGKGDFKRTAYTPFAQDFGYLLGIWLGRFVENGNKLSSEMLRELRDELGRIRFFHSLNPAIPSRGKPLPHWEYIADMNDFEDPGTTAAYAFSQQLTLDGFKGLRRCRMEFCQKFFTSRRKAKWCSGACGSRHRVRLKRKNDKRKRLS